MIYLKSSMLPEGDSTEAISIRRNNGWLYFNSLITHFFHLYAWFSIGSYYLSDDAPEMDYFKFRFVVVMFFYHFLVGIFGSFYLNFKIIRFKS